MEMDEMELDRYITSRFDTEYHNMKKDYSAKKPTPAKESPWWKQTANHIWRTYFQILERAESNPYVLPRLPTSERTAYNACNTVRNSFTSPDDFSILKMYYSIPKGQESDSVKQYSRDHNIPLDVIWTAVRHANRAVIEEIGLLDKK